VDGPAEILNCIGNVSEYDGKTFVHAHVALGLKDGTTKGATLLREQRSLPVNFLWSPFMVSNE
jgi:predicted DNA-binding protein with PD1-like motif